MSKFSTGDLLFMKSTVDFVHFGKWVRLAEGARVLILRTGVPGIPVEILVNGTHHYRINHRTILPGTYYEDTDV